MTKPVLLHGILGGVPVRVEVRVPMPVAAPFARNDVRLDQLGITPRELEILEAMAAGHSNREIAARMISRLYSKIIRSGDAKNG